MAIRKSAILASVISFFVTIIIPLYQWGFQIPYEILLKSLGVSWFIALLPQFLPQPTQLQWWRTYSLQSVYLLLSLATLGFLKRYAEWLGWLSWFVVGLGIVFGILTAFLYFKKMPFSFKKVGGYVFLGFLIGSYLLAQAYKFNFCPILLENLSALNVPFGYGDTVYHSACAKMFQTYEVFTTGLDGTPAMNYNVFTHWLNGHLAYFVEIPMYQFYNLSYPIIFFGFWFFAFLELAQRIYLFFCEKKQIQATALPTSLWFWLIFLCIIFPLPDNIYTRGLLGLHFVQTHTYTIALALLFIFVESLLTFWQKTQFQRVLVFVYFPLMSFVLGTAHVATIVAITAGAGYWFLRKKLFTKWYYWLWIVLIGFILVIGYLFTAETIPFTDRYKSYEGRFNWFFFFRNEEHNYDPFNFWVIFYGSLYVITFLLVIQEKITLKNWQYNQFAILVETLWVIAIAGLLPNIVLELYGTTGMYFLSVHRFLALSLLIAYITLITENFEKIPRNFKMIFLPILALFFLKMYGGNFYNSWKGNLEARKKIMKIGDEELSFEKRDVVKYLLNPFQFNWQKAKKLFSDSLQINLQKNDYYKFMRKIAELDSLPVAEKKEALLYIPFHKVHFPQWETIYATQDGMFLASISGLALLSGLPHPKYQVGAYGYGYYDHSLREKTWLQGFSLDELKKLTLQRGFRNLYIYQPETQSFEKIICSEPAK